MIEMVEMMVDMMMMIEMMVDIKTKGTLSGVSRAWTMCGSSWKYSCIEWPKPL